MLADFRFSEAVFGADNDERGYNKHLLMVCLEI